MHQKPANVSLCRAGFTVIELLVVMTVIAVVMSIAVPSFDLAGMRLNSSARQIQITLLRAQRLAVLRQHAVIVAFDTANRRLRFHEDVDSDGIIDDGEAINYVTLEDGVVFGRGATPAHTFGTAPISFVKRQGPLPAVTFTRGGSAGENGGLYITSIRAAETGAFPDETRAFDVIRGTGRSVMYSYSGNAWRRSY